MKSPEKSRVVADYNSLHAPRPPRDLRRSGARLWRDVVEALSLDSHELALLHEAARACDRCDELAAVLRSQGVIVAGKPNPLLREVREAQITFARLVAALRLPEDIREPGRRPQRRSGARGIYALRRGDDAS